MKTIAALTLLAASAQAKLMKARDQYEAAFVGE